MKRKRVSQATQVGGDNETPWEALGMSRASWYRHGKPAEKPPKQPRGYQRLFASMCQVSLRNLQRARFLQRWAPELVPEVTAGRIKFSAAEKVAKQARDLVTQHSG
jgi:hypothetical protein